MAIIDDVKAYLHPYGITTNVVPDTFIQARIDRSIMPYIERITGLSFNGVTRVEEIYSGNGTRTLYLNRRPISNLVSVRYTNFTDFHSVYVINIASIRVDKARGALIANAGYFRSGIIQSIFQVGKNNFAIEYEYGYDTMPDDVSEAVMYLTVENVLGYIAGTTGGGQTVKGRQYGSRGIYTEIRQDVTNMAHGILRKYITTMKGSV